MSLEEKLKNAKSTTWPADGIPKWRVFLIIHSAKLKVKLWRLWRKIWRRD